MSMHRPDLPKVVATDLDGTLLRPDGSVSDRTRRVLQRLDDAGVRVVFVTARPPRWLAELADLAGSHGTAICMNGAAVYDFETATMTDVCGFELGALGALVADLRTSIPGVALAVDQPLVTHPREVLRGGGGAQPCSPGEFAGAGPGRIAQHAQDQQSVRIAHRFHQRGGFSGAGLQVFRCGHLF